MHTQAAGAGVDLLCGPDSPLPEARQRYRLLYHLGAGGQAEVYRGVRLSAGVSSSPVTVKVFRPDPRRAVLEQLRSWDKGDAVLMDLNSRGVAGICLRVDGFYGLPPTVAGSHQISQQRIPYQVLDYLPGGTLIERLAGGASAMGPARLYGVAVLNTLADTLYELHHPTDAGDSPVLHMDVKPSNLIVLPDGAVRLIDFTTARYDHAAHITTIPHTPESAGPEAYSGHVGPAYDVHGFGSVAYYLITGWLPRADRSNLSPASATAPGGVRRHPLLDDHPALAAHLLAPLADRPEDRPRTDELGEWIAALARLAAALPPSIRFVDWMDAPSAPPAAPTKRVASMPAAATKPVASRAATQPISGPPVPTQPIGGPAGVTAPMGGFAAGPPAAGAAAAAAHAGQAGVPRQAGPTPTKLAHTQVAAQPPASGVDRLKQAARSRWAAWWAEGAAGAAGAGAGAGGGAAGAAAASGSGMPAGAAGARPAAPRPSAAPPPDQPPPPPKPPRIKGSAPVPVRQQPPKKRSRFDDPDSGQMAPVRPANAPPHHPGHDPAAPAKPWRSGKGYTKFGAKVVTVCWAVWFITALFKSWDLVDLFVAIGVVVAGAMGAYWLTRLAGHLLRTTLDRGPRHGTRVPNFVTMMFLVACGIQFLSFTPLAPTTVLAWLQGF